MGGAVTTPLHNKQGSMSQPNNPTGVTLQVVLLQPVF